MLRQVNELLARLAPSEKRVLGFLIGWALLGLLASQLGWSASFASSGREPVPISPDDPRAVLHAKSAALAAHLMLARTPPEAPLDPNTATREELDRLPGVGPKTALSWLAARASGGPFFALPDLERVRGLGPVRLEKMAPYLRFPPIAERRTHERSAALNLNSANEIELAELPRVGPVLAARIVARRRARGPFRSIADLDSVPGVGPRLVRELAGHVRFE